MLVLPSLYIIVINCFGSGVVIVCIPALTECFHLLCALSPVPSICMAKCQCQVLVSTSSFDYTSIPLIRLVIVVILRRGSISIWSHALVNPL
ncbi:uncharacterized protein RJT20DRAFT_51338 [Scheffersomyces xylosifermentans]|uniref:uncharacterized protein n=1 Tax=Scheffersomyces xylosifermentans TaxID=1304137 RepID=UPI00315D68A3